MKVSQQRDLLEIRRRLKRLDRRSRPIHFDSADAEQRLAELIEALPPGPVSDDMIGHFDDFCETYVAQWTAQVHRHFAPVLTELHDLYVKATPHVRRQGVIAEDLRARLREQDLAVTDVLYALADDDQPRHNPLRNDRRHANPPHEPDLDPPVTPPSPGA